MTTLFEALQEADRRRIAVGHFNVSDRITLYGVVEAARQQGLPVVVGVSEAERRFIGVQPLVAIIKSLRERGGPPIFLNADHTHSLSAALEAAQAGFDWVVCDFSALPFEENLRQTREAVRALKALRPQILVEVEIGDIGSGSQIHDRAPQRVLTSPDEALRFVQGTGIDTLAPAVGNMHGVLKSMLSGDTRKHLDIECIRAIKERTRIFMTLHGGTASRRASLRTRTTSPHTPYWRRLPRASRMSWQRDWRCSAAPLRNGWTLVGADMTAFKKVAILASMIGVGTLYASTEGGPRIPAHFQAWYLVNSFLVSKEPDRSGIIAGNHLVHVNSVGLVRLRAGGSAPYPEGTVFVDDVRDFSIVDKAYQEGARKAVTVMVKDSRKYAATGGWGFQAWGGGDPTKPIVTDATKQCFVCHTARKANDYVYSTYLQ